MSSMIFLVPISLALLGLAVWAFVWAVRRGQFDDLETPAVQILVDEPHPDATDAGQGDGEHAQAGSEAVPPSGRDEGERPPPHAD